MEEFEDDDFSDLYADVEVQASLALGALHRLTDKPPESDKNVNSASQGDVKNGDKLSGAEIPKLNGGFNEHVAIIEDERGDLTKLPMEDDDYVCDGDKVNKQGPDGNCSDTDNNVESGAVNMKRCRGTKGTDKNLKHDNLDSEKKRVDKGNDRDLCFRRADDDNRLIYGRNGVKLAFERDSSDARAYKSVQISDSDSAEDSRRVVSESDSERTPKRIEASDYKNRRNMRSLSNTEPSSIGPESSSQSERTHHAPSFSRSPRPSVSVSLSDDDIYKSPERSKTLSSENPSYEKPLRKELSQQRKKYNNTRTPDRNTCTSDDDVSYVPNVRRREMRNFDSNEKGFRSDGRDMSERRDTLKKCREMDYGAWEDEWNHNRRRHVLGNSDHLRKVVPKYPAFGTRGPRFCNRGDYGKYKRFVPHDDKNRYQVDCRYDRNIARDRREMESSEIGKRRRGYNFLDSSYELRYRETCWVHERDMRCSWKNTDIENGHHARRKNYQKSTNAYAMNGSMMGHHDQDHFVMRRHHQQFKVLHSRDEVYKHWHLPEGQSRYFESTSRNHIADDDVRHAFGHIADRIDERELGRHKFKTMRGDYNNRFDDCRKFIQPRSYRDSFEPRMGITEGRKCTQQRMPDAANDKYYDTHDDDDDDIMEWDDDQYHKYFKDSDNFETEKAITTNEGEVDGFTLGNKPCHDTLGEDRKNGFLDIEEGQVITEEIEEDPLKCSIASKDVNSNGIEGLGDDKIREIMVKMERRRARFMEPVKSARDFERISNKLLESDVGTDIKGTLERPTRKRRWC
ncbi:hypothetical protein CASFOL_038972 [Castilleja foliolosa]|uniref:Uncharacterized protein n=1 Tax=Castilleja foliolosa TaxID=1961234 RepID=A0ABD3BIH5_9LAMI